MRPDGAILFACSVCDLRMKSVMKREQNESESSISVYVHTQ